ncbi:MAG: hypothetical protein LKG27_05965 [Clostridiaceae bacterium]|jgi:hypothetical protein|nr:hypothetical protein [Clostridiaceae bacterium]
MAIANIQETLLLYSKQKAQLAEKISDVTMNLLSASKKVAASQSKYNQELDNYYQKYYEDDPDTYQVLEEKLQNEHEEQLAELNSWETKLETDKDNLETQYNEISSYESSWTKLLQQNVKSDFTYGGSGGSK